MSDSVRRIKRSAFSYCTSLVFVRLSRNLVVIGEFAFCGCDLLSSIFLPPSCRGIGRRAFYGCSDLRIFNVPRHTHLGEGVIERTALIRASSLEVDQYGDYDICINENVNEWIKNINGDDGQFALHRACSSYNPITEIIYGIVKRQGLNSFKKENEVVITPVKYLEANPFAEDIDQSSVVKIYVLEMMGEAV